MTSPSPMKSPDRDAADERAIEVVARAIRDTAAPETLSDEEWREIWDWYMKYKDQPECIVAQGSAIAVWYRASVAALKALASLSPPTRKE